MRKMFLTLMVFLLSVPAHPQDRASGTGAASLSVSVQHSGLAPGVYYGAIVITAPAITGGLATVGVTLTVTARAP